MRCDMINFSGRPARGRVALPWSDLRGRSWRLTELLEENTYVRDGDELVDPGLFVERDAWRWHLLSLSPQRRVAAAWPGTVPQGRLEGQTSLK
ncbi:hypothetical protein [Streptomyces chiangmaiensis]|uniref:Uncharacterized protein n=1 Tax=Streptomyces chiangmaiensis TaxID=766497 RepID=A0ABU7FSQ2_9ACTN|nr:hypothetical protein [Streptomyces chiangmaiensis]MED7827141.1 hypothetical protein [Streptomyces chiangmaiensis]